MVRVFKSTKREDIVARELQKQEIYTEKRTDNLTILGSFFRKRFSFTLLFDIFFYIQTGKARFVS